MFTITISTYHFLFDVVIRYATVYTMAPVFSLVLDEDVSSDVALTYPELYQELMKVVIKATYINRVNATIVLVGFHFVFILTRTSDRTLYT